jgi:hypothetical protein
MGARVSDVGYTHIRSLPRAQVISLLKDARTTQAMIGRRSRVSQSYVGRVIAGREPLRPSKGSERVWKAIETALAVGTGRP